MKIYTLNDVQSHSESVRRNVSLAGSVVLRGFEIYGVVQLLEGSHRMVHAVELGLPITVVLFKDDEIVPHDCDDIKSHATGLYDYATAKELAHALIIERGLLMYKVPVYESDDFSNIKIIKPVNETGTKLHERLIKNSPFSAFPQKVWEVIFGEIKDVVNKRVLSLGKRRQAEAFEMLGADVTFVDTEDYLNIGNINGKQYDLIYASDIHNDTNLIDLLSCFKQLLKDGGIAVILNNEQTPEMMADAGLNNYWFSEEYEKHPKASFVRQ